MIKLNLYSWGLFARVTILLGLCLLAGLVFLSPDWVFTQIVIFALIALLTTELNWYLQKTNRDLSRFLETLKYEEYKTSFADRRKVRYAQLHLKMEEIKQQHETKKELYQQTVSLYKHALENIDLGILLFNKNRAIILENSLLTQWLNLPQGYTLKSIENTIPNFLNAVENASDNAYLSINSKTFPGYLGMDLVCHINKFKHLEQDQTLLIFSTNNNSQLGSDFETYINFGKVISHEILNGISPLISLSNTLQSKVSQIEANEQSKASLQKALKVIQERCESLQGFAERYRTLHRLPEPDFQILTWNEVIQKSLKALNEKLHKEQISVSLKGNALDQSFKADSWQMDQVFTNLLLNSIHALTEKLEKQKLISIEVNTNHLNYSIHVHDNGTGIAKNIRSNVFVPFFSTRENGSGIGLSVVKQILWKHRAEIFLTDQTEGATFSIRFPKV